MNFELAETLERLRKEGRFVDVRVCPRCKSPRIRRVGSMQGDTSGHMAMTPPKFECLDCGWIGRLTIFATNRPLTKNQMEVASQSIDQDREKER